MNYSLRKMTSKAILFLLPFFILSCGSSSKDYETYLTNGSSKKWILEKRTVIGGNDMYWGLDYIRTHFCAILEFDLDEKTVDQWFFERIDLDKNRECCDTNNIPLKSEWTIYNDEIIIKGIPNQGYDQNFQCRINSLSENELELIVLDKKGEEWIVGTYIPLLD